MNAATGNIVEVVNEAIQMMPLSAPGAEQLLLAMLRSGIRQSEVERMARQYGIEGTDLQCSLLNCGISIIQRLLHLAVEKGIPPVHALAMLRSNAAVYNSLITERDDSALLEFFEQMETEVRVKACI